MLIAFSLDNKLTDNNFKEIIVIKKIKNYTHIFVCFHKKWMIRINIQINVDN